MIEKSTSRKFGPTRKFLPRLPNVPRVGSTNAFGLYHCAGFPVTMGLELENPEAKDGRSVPAPVLAFPDWLTPEVTPNGIPVATVTIELICHPLSSLSKAPVTPFKKALSLPMGSSYRPLKTNRCN